MYKKILIVLISRKDYLDSLKQILLKHYDEYDECRMWLNTDDDDKNQYHIFFQDNKKIKIIERDKVDPASNPFITVNHFYKTDAIDENAIYIKIDDDMLWFEDKFFSKLFDLRLKYQNYFLIFPLIINNAVISHLLMRFGKLDWMDRCWYHPQDPTGWGSGFFAEELHNQFLSILKNRGIENLKFDKWILDLKELVTINTIAFFGSDMKLVCSTMNTHTDEHYLTHYGPSIVNKRSVILGHLVCSHYAFMPQKPHLDKTSILDEYKNLADSV